MADTRPPGNLNPPGGMCRVPARTPGVLGVLDQGDPNHTSWMGDSPGVLGVNDHADRSLSGLSARAFVTGDSLSFADWLNPDRLVVAHELTHVVQGGGVLTIGSSTTPPQAVERDPTLWKKWTPPAGYDVLFELLVANEGNISHLYLDSKNKVTVGIGTYLSSAAKAKALRFYHRVSQAVATEQEIGEAYDAVVAATPDAAKYPKGRVASAYKDVTQLDMTPTDIGERWMADVKSFQKLLPSEFSGFAGYPADAKQALTDIAYQYGARGAATKAASGKIKENAEKGDWAAAAALCASLEGSTARNTKRKEMFEAAALAAPLKP
jgi:GH24 family phage-related lysozyme (muramidase)